MPHATVGSKHPTWEKAAQAWRDFHTSLAHPRKNVDFESELVDPWPKSWTHAGTAKTTYYSSDKWKPKGTTERYYHDHKDGVQVWVDSAAAKRLGLKEDSKGRKAGKTRQDLPAPPDAVALLGDALGVDIVRPDGSKGKLVPEAGAVLVCSPDRKVLYIIEGDVNDNGRVVAMITGPSLTVEPRGIVG